MLVNDGLMETVADAMQEVAAEVIEPRFGRLVDGDVSEKAAGELVTTADREAEVLLTRRLQVLLPGVPVVGEEATAEDPALLKLLATESRVWLVDPVDGTSNFVDGSPDYAVMVALLHQGETVGSWIWLPETKFMYVAERGAGAFENGERLRISAAPRPPTRLRGVVKTTFLDAATAAAVEKNRHHFTSLTEGWRCAGVSYPRLIAGDVDFILYWRTLPWDHAPGVLLLQEAGGHAFRPDGDAYRAGDERLGLLLAPTPEIWRLVADRLLSAPTGRRRSAQGEGGGATSENQSQYDQ